MGSASRRPSRSAAIIAAVPLRWATGPLPSRLIDRKIYLELRMCQTRLYSIWAAD